MDVVVPFSRRWTPKAAELLKQAAIAGQRPLRRRHSDQEKLSRESLQKLNVDAVRRMHQDFQRNPKAWRNVGDFSSWRTVAEESKNHHYEAMIERFQLRRLISLPSTEAKTDLATGTLSHRNSMDQIAELAPHLNPDPTPTARKSSIPSISRRTSHNSSRESARNHIVRVSVTELMSPVLRVSDEKLGDDGSNSDDEAWRRGEARRAWRRKMARSIRRVRNDLKCPISPYSMTACVRHSIVLAVLVLYLLRLPMKLAFPDDYGQKLNWVDRTTEAVLLIDFALNFNTAFVNEHGDFVTERKFIVWNYLVGWSLLDFFSSISLKGNRATHSAWVAFLCDGVLRWMRFVHLIWVIHVLMAARARLSTKGVAAWLLYSRHSHLLRIMWILLLIVLLAHYMACAWKVLESPSPSFPQVKSNLDAYASNFYDALQLLHGQGLETDTLGQNLFAAMAVLVGSVVLAVVFGHVAILVSNFNANSTNYQRKMESVFAVMTKMQLPVLLRERIHQYYEHLWREYESLDGQLIHFSKELTHTLELEVVLFKYMEVVMQIPFWHDSSSDFLKQIVLQIQVRVYLPDDYILRRGEVGDEYYIINRGVCEMIRGDDSIEHGTVCPVSEVVVSTNAAEESSRCEQINSGGRSESSSGHEHDHLSIFEVHKDLDAKQTNRSDQGYERSQHSQDDDAKYGTFLSTLGRGQGFGELALLTNYPRTSNTRAITYVEMCVLRRRDFQVILLRHPEDRKRVLERMLLHTMENNEALGVDCPLLQTVRSVFADKEAPVSVAMAADMVTKVINPDLQDNSIMFGIGTNLSKDLTALRDHGLVRQEVATCSNFNTARSDKQRVRGYEFVESARSTVSVDYHEATTTSRILNEVTNNSVVTLPSLSPAGQMQDIEVAQRELLRLLYDMRTDLMDMRHRQGYSGHSVTPHAPIPVIDCPEASLSPIIHIEPAPPLIKPARRLRQGVKRTHSAPSKTLEMPIRLFKWRRRNSYSEAKVPTAKREASSIYRLSRGIRRITSDHADYLASPSPFTGQLFQRKSNPTGTVVLAPIALSSLTAQGYSYAKQKSLHEMNSNRSPLEAAGPPGVSTTNTKVAQMAVHGSDHAMMLEILSLLCESDGSCDGDPTENHCRANESLCVANATTTAEPSSIQAISDDTLSSLKKQLRAQESSRRYRKRKKDTIQQQKEHVTQLKNELRRTSAVYNDSKVLSTALPNLRDNITAQEHEFRNRLGQLKQATSVELSMLRSLYSHANE